MVKAPVFPDPINVTHRYYYHSGSCNPDSQSRERHTISQWWPVYTLSECVCVRDRGDRDRGSSRRRQEIYDKIIRHKSLAKQTSNSNIAKVNPPDVLFYQYARFVFRLASRIHTLCYLQLP